MPLSHDLGPGPVPGLTRFDRLILPQHYDAIVRFENQHCFLLSAQGFIICKFLLPPDRACTVALLLTLTNPPSLLLHPYSASSFNFLSLVPNSSLGVIHAPFGFATVSSKTIDTSRCLCDLQFTSANISVFFISVFTMLSSTKIGVLGGGQLGRMLVGAANRLNIQMNVLDSENAPAKQISAHEGHVTGSFTDRASLRKLAEACDILTAEIEHVDTYALEEVASEIKVEPSWKTIRIIQDKFHQKEYLSKFNIPMAEYRELRRNSTEELTVIGEELGYPLMLKSKTQAYDGRGKREISSLSTFIFHASVWLKICYRKLPCPDRSGHTVSTRSPKGSATICGKMGEF